MTVTNMVHIHLQPTSMCGFDVSFFWGGGGVGYEKKIPTQINTAVVKKPYFLLQKNWAPSNPEKKKAGQCKEKIIPGSFIQVLTVLIVDSPVFEFKPSKGAIVILRIKC